MREAGGQPAALQGERELGGAELQVALPLVLRIEAERDHRQQLTRVRVGEVEDVLAGEEAPAAMSSIVASGP